MLRKILLGLALLAVLLPLGCYTRRPYPWGWPHNKRRINTMVAGMEEAVNDFDRIILQNYETFPDKLYQANIDFDRIVFGMEERTLEDM